MSSARSFALNLLKKRLRSAWEIDQALLRREVPAEERQEIIEELTEHNLINDERYALAWVHTRDRLAPRGKFLLEQELIQKGIDKATIRLIMQKRQEEIEDDPDMNPDEDAQIRSLIERRTRLYAHLPEDVRKRRMIAMLARKGFLPGKTMRIYDSYYESL
jgi:regulatory protein